MALLKLVAKFTSAEFSEERENLESQLSVADATLSFKSTIEGSQDLEENDAESTPNFQGFNRQVQSVLERFETCNF